MVTKVQVWSCAEWKEKKEKSGIRALQMPDQSVCFTMFFHWQNTVSVLDKIRSLLDDIFGERWQLLQNTMDAIYIYYSRFF